MKINPLNQFAIYKSGLKEPEPDWHRNNQSKLSEITEFKVLKLFSEKFNDQIALEIQLN